MVGERRMEERVGGAGGPCGWVDGEAQLVGGGGGKEAGQKGQGQKSQRCMQRPNHQGIFEGEKNKPEIANPSRG